MTPKQKCQQIAHAMDCSVSLTREGRYLVVEAVAPCRKMFAVNGSHYLTCSEFDGFKGGADRLWNDMADRLQHEELMPCPSDCDCWDGEECCHG